jgi:hypothetical protein
MDTIHLDITKYSDQDLIELLDIKEKSVVELNQKCDDLSLTVSGSESLDLSRKNDIQDFIAEVKRRLAAKFMTRLAFAASDNHQVIDQHDPILPEIEHAPFSRDVLNPIRIKQYETAVNIDSLFRAEYYKTSAADFFIDLVEPFNNVLSLQLGQIDVPNAIYTFTRKNNTFVINQTGTDYLITITPGNYTASELAAHINGLLAAAGLASIAFSINDNTGRSRFEDSVPTVFTVTFPENSENPLATSGWFLGFRNSVYIGSSIYTSEGLYQGNGWPYLYLAVDDFNKSINDGIVGVFQKSILRKNILAKLPLVNSRYIFSVQFPTANQFLLKRRYFGPVDLRRLRVSLLDPFGNVVELNNTDYSMVLHMEQLYQY